MIWKDLTEWNKIVCRQTININQEIPKETMSHKLDNLKTKSETLHYNMKNPRMS